MFTGEGSVDLQSKAGKVPLQVALAAAELGVRTVVFGGRIDDSLATESISPVLAYVPIVRSVSTIEQALGDGQKNLELAVTLCCRLLLA